MFFKAFPWGNKDKSKVKVRINAVPLARQFSSKFSFKKDRHAATLSAGLPTPEDVTRQPSQEDISAARVENLRVLQPCIEKVTIVEDTQDSPLSYGSDGLIQTDLSPEVVLAAASFEPSTTPAPELPLAPLLAESSVDETLARLTSAFADSVSGTDSCSDVLPLGDPTTDDYIFQCVLGDGSEGIVFLTIGRRDRKPYAVKVVPKDVFPEGQYGNLFTSQYAMKAMKGSPFIIDLQAAFETTENFIFVFPFYANGDLKEEMHEVGRYSEPETRTRIAQLVIALQELHSNRIMHRDLKPENILLNARGDFVLTDFGLCHTFGRSVEEQPWRVAGLPDWELSEDYDLEGYHEAGGGDKTRLFCGTPNYIAPEVYGEGSDGWYSYPADVWSFGIILYEMLHGKLPFGLSHEEVDEFDPMTCILYAELIVDDRLSENAHDLLSMLLEKDPNQRPGWDAVKSHPWFNGIDWESVAPKEQPPAPLMITLEDLPPVPEDIRNIKFGEPYSNENPPYPHFQYTSPDHLQPCVSTSSSLYMGSPNWMPTPSVLEGFGWPVASPGNAFAMCPRLSSAPNLQKTREVPSFRVLHTPFYGSIGWDDDDGDDDIDESSMCSALAQNMRTGRVPGLDADPSTRESAPYPFSRQPSFVLPVADRSVSAESPHDTFAGSVGSKDSPKGKAKEFLGDARAASAFQSSSSTHSDVLAATPKRPLVLAPASNSSPDSPTRNKAPSKSDAFVPVTSTPMKGTRKVPEQRTAPTTPATPAKESESATLSDIIQFSDIPSFCLSTPERQSGSSAASPVDATSNSNFSRTMVGSTLSGEGAFKFAGFKLTLTSDTSEDSQPQPLAEGDISTSSSDLDSLSSSPFKPWTKKVVGLVKGWLKPAHRREKRRAFDAN
ncbi:kinase-like domain-containing protein [Ganoderma leucocontextum]|nr:kinase-like domain-containing protein [Ganoderma leucocontextum]